jgi:hypothetical protein
MDKEPFTLRIGTMAAAIGGEGIGAVVTGFNYGQIIGNKEVILLVGVNRFHD